MRSLSLLALLCSPAAWAVDDEPVGQEDAAPEQPAAPTDEGTEADEVVEEEVDEPVVDEAEALRLVHEIKALAGRNAWSGVDRNYVDLLATGADITSEMHDIGAQAARAQGNAGAAYSRGIRSARSLDLHALPVDLRAYHDGFARLTVRRVDASGISIEPAEMPFEADRRAAIEFARQSLSETGGFDGLLPLGTYTVGGQYTVELAEGASSKLLQREGADGDVGKSSKPAKGSKKADSEPVAEDQAPMDTVLDADTVQSVAGKQSKKIDACQSDDGAAGDVVVDFTVRSGKVSGVAVSSSSAADSVAECVAQAVGRWSFGRKDSGNATWTAVFEQQDAEPTGDAPAQDPWTQD